MKSETPPINPLLDVKNLYPSLLRANEAVKLLCQQNADFRGMLQTEEGIRNILRNMEYKIGESDAKMHDLHRKIDKLMSSLREKKKKPSKRKGK